MTALREIHLLHERVRDIRQHMDQGPRQLKKYQAKIENQQKRLADLHDEIKHLKVSIRDKEAELKANEQKIARYEQQRNTAGSKKEYDALLLEIANQKRLDSKIEDEILEKMGLVDEKTAQIPEYEKSLKAAQDEARKVADELTAQRPDWDKRLADAQAALQALEAQLSADQRAVYDRLVKAYGPDALAAVRDGTCTGCNIELTPQGRQNLDRDLITTCKNCGRLVYLPE
jgi:predicted  nucleic acid-binding Zn-ribbon protein